MYHRLKVTFYSCIEYERPLLNKFNNGIHELIFLEEQLSESTIILAKGSDIISIRSSDNANDEMLQRVTDLGVRFICLRTTGYNNIDLLTAEQLGIQVARVSVYSPEAIAEHAIALILVLSRNLIEADHRVHAYNFSLVGLCGFNLSDKTVGVIGTGKIGAAFVKILNGFGSQIIAYDPAPDASLIDKYGVSYVSKEELYERADIISLHLPLNKHTYHILDEKAFLLMKDGVIIINTSRGDHINTEAMIRYLEAGKISSVGLDVYANEKKYFFKDHSQETIEDDTLIKLISMDNVLLTGHQAFLTETAISNIAETTFENISHFQNKTRSLHFL